MSSSCTGRQLNASFQHVTVYFFNLLADLKTKPQIIKKRSIECCDAWPFHLLFHFIHTLHGSDYIGTAYYFDFIGAMNTTVPRFLNDTCSRSVGTFTHYLRMPPSLFNNLATKLRPFIEKETTQLREPVDVDTRLACTSRYLATGLSMSNLHYEFNLGW